MISKVCTKNQWKTMENMNIHWSKSMLARTSPLGVGKFLNPFWVRVTWCHPKTPLHSQHGPPRIAMLAIPLEPSAPQVFVPWFFRDFVQIRWGHGSHQSDRYRLRVGFWKITPSVENLNIRLFRILQTSPNYPLNEKNYRIASYNCWLRVVLVCSRVRLENS